MAKKTSKTVQAGSVVINTDLLKSIAAAAANGTVAFVGKTPDVEALINAGFIEINTGMPNPANPSEVAARATPSGLERLNVANAPVTTANEPVTAFGIISNAVLPPSKRGNAKGGGAPKKYPFDQLEIGQSFFVAKSEDYPDPVKTLGSVVSAANMRYAKETGEMRTVERTKRGEGNKAVLDAQGNKVKETVQVPVHKFERKFSLRSVSAGTKYGEWVAPADGALIARVPVEDNKAA